MNDDDTVLDDPAVSLPPAASAPEVGPTEGPDLPGETIGEAPSSEVTDDAPIASTEPGNDISDPVADVADAPESENDDAEEGAESVG